jgi:hypothetical protein
MSYCKKIGAENRRGINLSFMPIAVTDIAARPPLIVAECCSFVSPAHAAGPSRDCDISGGPVSALAGSDRPEEDRGTP